MKILLNNNDLNEALYGVSNLGFVPTMGALHKGHVSLIKRSLRECKKTIVSIFVNPTQFNDKKDYKTYPRNNKKDLFLLRKLNVDFLYMPSKKNVYDSFRKSKITINKNNKILCAKFRKGHFEGVIDVVDRMTNKIRPKKIFMGEKDFQQLYLIKNYIEKKYGSKIIRCKTIRDSGKMALSSRNNLLNKKKIIIARKLAQNIISYKKKLTNKKVTKKSLFIKKLELIKKYKVDIEYFELRNISNLKISNKILNSKIFIAFHIGKIRLIDNF